MPTNRLQNCKKKLLYFDKISTMQTPLKRSSGYISCQAVSVISILLIVPETPQLPCVAAPVFIDFYVKLYVNLLTKKLLKIRA